MDQKDTVEDQESIREQNKYLSKKLLVIEDELKENQKELQNMIYLYEKKIKDQELNFDTERNHFR